MGTELTKSELMVSLDLDSRGIKHYRVKELANGNVMVNYGYVCSYYVIADGKIVDIIVD